MMIHPKFNPVAISIDPIAIRWYALSYIVGFMLFLWLGRRRIKQGNTAFTKEMLDDFLTWGVLGVILGGRLGYILFYKFSYYLEHPLEMPFKDNANLPDDDFGWSGQRSLRLGEAMLSAVLNVVDDLR